MLLKFHERNTVLALYKQVADKLSLSATCIKLKQQTIN